MDSTRIDPVEIISGSHVDPHENDFFTVLLNKSIYPVVYVTKDYQYRYVNKAYADWFGTSVSEITGRLVAEFLGAEVFARIKDYMATVLKGNEVHFEADIPFKNKRRFIDANYIPDFDENGKVKGYVAILTDITQKKQTEKELQNKQQELKNSKAHYEKLLTMLPAAVYTTDRKGHITFYNEAAASLWGRYPVIGQEKWSGFSKIYRQDGITPVPLDASPIAMLLKEGRKIAGEELVVELADGTRRNVLPNPQPLYDSEGKLTGAINMVLDITQQREADQYRATLAAIVQSSDDAIISKTLEGIITSWNESAERLFGYKDEEIIGQSVMKLIPADRIDEEPKILERLKRGERVDHFETKRISKDGRIVDLSLTISPIRDATGKIIGASKIARDIGEQKETVRLSHENEERFRMAVEATGLGTWDLRVSTGTLEWSNECKRIYQVPAEMDVDLEFFFEHVHPEDREQVEKEMKKALNPSGEGNYDTRFRILRHSDRQLRWVRAQGKAMFNENGQPDRFIGTILDITKEQLQQEELIESVELFQTMAENVPAMIWMSGSDKFNDYFNKTWLEFTGRTLAEESNEGWVDGVHLDDRQKCIDTYNQSLKEQKGFYLEYRLRRQDGVYRWIADNSVPRYSADGTFLGFISASIDIDDQKSFREKIQGSELLFKTISNTSPAALWMTDRNRNNIFVSETWLKWTGRTFNEEISLGWVSAIHEDEREKIIERFFECFNERKNFAAEFRIPCAEGVMRWCLTEGKPYFDITGAFAGYAGSVTDITELKSLEQRKDDFIKMASHELKTPITSIKGYVQLLLNIYQEAEDGALQASRSTVKSSLGTIAKQVTKLTRLISELLDLSKIETGKLELNCTPFDLTELVEEVVQDVRLTTSKHAIIVESNFEDTYYGDKDRIGQVLMNLINNAIKYSPDADTVEILVEGDKEKASIRVKDYGIGIDKKDFKKIFERFYRAEGKAEQTYPGFGIGLFIASEIVQRHKGTIDVSSEKGKGSIFTVNLPLDFHK
ncbi:MAG TPA: PAS domain S-box protein [Chitinophagaceae bacterium]|nr:PAS domain S-box protein [Chitinophagaceae bacterium]